MCLANPKREAPKHVHHNPLTDRRTSVNPSDKPLAHYSRGIQVLKCEIVGSVLGLARLLRNSEFLGTLLARVAEIKWKSLTLPLNAAWSPLVHSTGM